jgi:hypothetical protein
VDDPAIDEPGEGIIEAGEMLAWETTLPVKGVQEVEGGVQIDAMGVASIGVGSRGCQHRDNHLTTFDRLRASR